MMGPERGMHKQSHISAYHYFWIMAADDTHLPIHDKSHDKPRGRGGWQQCKFRAWPVATVLPIQERDKHVRDSSLTQTVTVIACLCLYFPPLRQYIFLQIYARNCYGWKIKWLGRDLWLRWASTHLSFPIEDTDTHYCKFETCKSKVNEPSQLPRIKELLLDRIQKSTNSTK